MLVRDYMTPNPITIAPKSNFPEAMRLMRDNGIHRLPVVEGGELVGIVVEEDLLSNQPSPATTLSVFEVYSLLDRLRVEQIMTSPVVVVSPDCPLEEAARALIEHQIGALPVMDGDELVGIITETDIFKAMVEVLGGHEQGYRIVVRVPERVGELSRLAGVVAEAGGNILALTTSKIREDGGRDVTIKESGADESALRSLFEREELQVLDLRSTAECGPWEV